jgi:hypothetical protein
MRINLCYAAFGLAVAASTGSANAQTVITREVVSPPVDTVVTQPATETVITRQPLATMPAETVVEEPYQTVETIQTTRPARTVSRQVTTTRQVVRNHKPARTVRRSTTSRASLTPAQERTIYRVIRRERVIPAQTVTERIVTAPVQRVVTAPAYPPPAYVAPGYEQPSYTEVMPDPRYRYDAWADDDRYEADRYPDQVVVAQPEFVSPPPVEVERDVTTPIGVAIGAQLPSTVPVYAMPSAAIAQVPNISGYRYAYVNGRILLVDPNTNIVLATLRQ